MNDAIERSRESRLRGIARRQDLSVRKDRAKTWGCHHLGGYMIVDPDRNAIVAGENDDLSLDDLEEFLTGEGS